MFAQTKLIVDKITRERPLILNLTNDVTIDFVANGLLSLGASPIMSNSLQEVEALLQVAHALVINIGTLDDAFVALCMHACEVANRLGKPIIFDPVGAGATHYRTNVSLQLLKQYQFAVIRGNASEIMALNQTPSMAKGVDSLAQTEQAIMSAKALAQQYHTTIVISGATDVVVDATTMQSSDRGSALMPLVTGTGCLLSAVIAAFCAVEKNSMLACLAATTFYGICGEIAEQQTSAPGSFKIHLIDALHAMPVEADYAT